MKRVVLVALVAGAGCAGDVDRGNLPPPPGPLVLAPDGLRVGGTGLEIGFGRSQAGAVAAAARLLGEAPLDPGESDGCQIALWPSGLVMAFRDGGFVGWAAPAETYARASDLAGGEAGVLQAGDPCAAVARVERLRI